MSREKVEHLKNLLKNIDSLGNYESNFQKVCELLRNEKHAEERRDSNYSTNKFLDDLKNTEKDQAEEYRSASKTNKPKAYRKFIDYFKQDVQEEIGRLEP
jgi:hypothetical protein